MCFFYCENFSILSTARFIGINERRWNDQSYPTLVNSFGDTVIWDIAVGSEFILALDSKGDVWAWGSNTDGQLGLAHTDPQPVPIRVPKLQGLGIAQISAGNNKRMFQRTNTSYKFSNSWPRDLL